MTIARKRALLKIRKLCLYIWVENIRIQEASLK